MGQAGINVMESERNKVFIFHKSEKFLSFMCFFVIIELSFCF
jgi:hypothetical protein